MVPERWHASRMVYRWSAAAAVLLAVVCFGGRDAPEAVAPHLRWPVAVHRVVAPYEAPPGPYAAGHRGIDLAAAPGDGVVAPADGIVTFSGMVVDRPVVTVQIGEGVLVSLEPVVADVPRGASVAAGQPLGTVGHGGHCDARCLHLGVRVDGAYVSPLLFIGGVPPAVLLPLP